MFNYLQKYNKLPKDVRDKLSARPVMSAIESLEKEYGFSLAAVVMKVVIKDINVNSLEVYFEQNHALTKEKSKNLSNELKEKIFSSVSAYLGVSMAEVEPKPAQIQPLTPQTMPVEKSSEVGIGDLVKNIPTKEEKAEVQPIAPAPSSVGGSEVGIKSENKANFFFSQEDEQEIGELVKKVGEHVDKPDSNNADEKINKIIGESQVSFGSEELMSRFRKILKTYVSGVREKMDTKQTLIKSVESGGLGFENNAVDKIIVIADKYIKLLETEVKTSPQKKITVPEDDISQKKTKNLKDLGARDVDYDLKSLENKGKSSAKLDISHKLAPPPPKIIKKDEALDKVSLSASKEDMVPDSHKKEKDLLAPPPPVKKEEVEQKKSIFSPSSFFKKGAKENTEKPKEEKKESAKDFKDPFSLIKSKDTKQATEQVSHASKKDNSGKSELFATRKNGQVGGKIRMDDVKFKPKTMGPIDELRYMDLINFRRLDDDPLIAANKIKEKIELMDNYSEKMESIKAWRSSPVNKIYLKMGEASISSKKPIDAIIEERRSSGKEYLNNKELEAVIRLNKSLRF